MNYPALADAFRETLAALVGCPCWDVSAGRGTGSFVLVSFGKKVPRERELRNPRLNAERRKFRGEYELYIMSSWRLDSTKQVICGAWDDNSANGPMVNGLSHLRGATVKDISLDKVALDLTLHFGNGFSLRIFSNQLSGDGWENYHLGTPVGTYVVDLQSELRFEASLPSEIGQVEPPPRSSPETAR